MEVFRLRLGLARQRCKRRVLAHSSLQLLVGRLWLSFSLAKQSSLGLAVAMLRLVDATDVGRSCPWSVDVDLYCFADSARSGLWDGALISGAAETGMSEGAGGEKLLASAVRNEFVIMSQNLQRVDSMMDSIGDWAQELRSIRSSMVSREDVQGFMHRIQQLEVIAGMAGIQKSHDFLEVHSGNTEDEGDEYEDSDGD